MLVQQNCQGEKNTWVEPKVTHPLTYGEESTCSLLFSVKKKHWRTSVSFLQFHDSPKEGCYLWLLWHFKWHSATASGHLLGQYVNVPPLSWSVWLYFSRVSLKASGSFVADSTGMDDALKITLLWSFRASENDFPSLRKVRLSPVPPSSAAELMSVPCLQLSFQRQPPKSEAAFISETVSKKSRSIETLVMGSGWLKLNRNSQSWGPSWWGLLEVTLEIMVLWSYVWPRAQRLLLLKILQRLCKWAFDDFFLIHHFVQRVSELLYTVILGSLL